MKSIQNKMAVYFAITILIVATGLTTTAYFTFKNLMIEELEQSLELMTLESAELVGKILQSNLTPLIQLANSDGFRELDVEKQVKRIKDFNLSFYEGLAIVCSNGFAHYTDGDVLDLSDRPYIQSVLRGESNYSDLIISSKLSVPVIMGAIPIIDDEGGVSGAIIARVRLEEINALIERRGYGKSGFAYIIDGSGYYIFSGDEKSFKEGANALINQNQENESSEFIRFLEFSKSHDIGVGQYQKGVETIWMGFACIDNTNWKIYVGVLESEMLLGLNRLRNTFIVLNVLLVTLTIFLTRFLSRRLTKPILALDQAFIQATNGDMNVRVSLQTNDEIQRAGSNFNKMMDYINTLTYDDPVTQLPNLSVLEIEMGKIIGNEGTLSNEKHTIFLVTINGLDRINELLGYSYGNGVLKKVGMHFKELFHLKGNVYKGRAEDFLIVCESMPYKHAMFLATEILNAPEIVKIQLNGKVTFDLSIGIDFVHFNQNRSLEELLTSVTHARNTAKEHGINKICFYNESTHLKKREIQSLEEDLVDVVEKKGFNIVYQPFYEIEKGQLSGAEALIRWQSATKGQIAPDIFIPLAEKMGLVHHIDYWVIEKVFSDFSLLDQSFLMSINITSHSFERDDFISYVEKQLKSYKIDSEKIQFELTERALVKDIQTTIPKLLKLREMGIKIAIDDFGVGYSSLSYILKLPVDCIKIDRSFIKEINESLNAKTIVATILTMSQSLNLKTVAEGVETAEIVNELRHLKCNHGQGYYYSRPMHFNELLKLFI